MNTKYLLFYLLISFTFSIYAEKITFSFEKDFEVWGQWKAEGAVAKFLHDEKTGHSELGSVSIILGPENSLDKSACFTKHFSVKAGGSYTALVYLKAKDLDKTASISLGFQGQDAKKKFLGTEVRATRLLAEQYPEGEWVRLVYTIIIEDTGRWAQAENLLCTIGISKSSKGQVWFDDFCFFENK